MRMHAQARSTHSITAPSPELSPATVSLLGRCSCRVLNQRTKLGPLLLNMGMQGPPSFFKFVGGPCGRFRGHFRVLSICRPEPSFLEPFESQGSPLGHQRRTIGHIFGASGCAKTTHSHTYLNRCELFWPEACFLGIFDGQGDVSGATWVPKAHI